MLMPRVTITIGLNGADSSGRTVVTQFPASGGTDELNRSFATAIKAVMRIPVRHTYAPNGRAELASIGSSQLRARVTSTEVSQEGRKLKLDVSVVNVTIEGNEFALVESSVDLLPLSIYVLYTLL